MPFSSTQNPSTRYSLVVFLILALFLCAIFFYVRNNRTTVLLNNIHQLSELKEDYSQIDSCIIVLYNADNNCRLFAATGQKNYIQRFTSDIDFVSNTLDDMNSRVNENEKNGSKNIKTLVDQKKSRTELYLKLRLLTDSLINISSNVDTNTRVLVNTNNNFTYKKIKRTVKVDTIITPIKVQPKPKFFERLAAVFSKKKPKVEDTAYKVVRTETKIDTSSQNKNSSITQLQKLNNLYLANSMLKKNEIAILQINNRLIAELVSLLQNYKKHEMTFVSQNRKQINEDIHDTFKSLDTIFILSILILLILVSAILYNIWKIYKNENALIKYSQKTSQYAISKSRFLANMSHEIRTPLNSIIGFSEQLSHSKLNYQQTEQLTAIENSSRILLDVVNDILDFSKYETGKVSFDKISFIPFDAITEVYTSMSILASKKGVELKKDISFNNSICFSGDSLRLKQVVMNLLSNAIKFTEKGSVTLKADFSLNDKKQAVLKVHVIDTGIGITPENLDMIFDEFAQVYYSSTKVKQKGTGLGLAICKKIVEFQNGKIGVSSRLGMGSIFSFEIPYELCNKSVEIIKTTVSTFDNLEGKRVLLADDNKLNVLLIQTVIKKYKIITDVAYDGKEAFELFRHNTYDLILTDIQMPEMGGVELTRKIRLYADPAKMNTPILGVTANVLKEDREKYIESGINDLVLKPFSEQELMDKIVVYVLGQSTVSSGC
ncbi:ATP-binding protein [Pedobacter boryungensis]|uniref:histidine kinase n=1 Tax=Pedobacter boryungensis TaxID=869962 RepID=A0ABX2D7Z6_9SPHI|nr:ATP-binding protein [Pedobacter boryungensis]NQX30105.1 response regulator [Pedobacter boryungensis]